MGVMEEPSAEALASFSPTVPRKARHVSGRGRAGPTLVCYDKTSRPQARHGALKAAASRPPTSALPRRMKMSFLDWLTGKIECPRCGTGGAKEIKGRVHCP